MVRLERQGRPRRSRSRGSRIPPPARRSLRRRQRRDHRRTRRGHRRYLVRRSGSREPISERPQRRGNPGSRGRSRPDLLQRIHPVLALYVRRRAIGRRRMYRLVLPRASEEAPRPKVGIGRSWLARWGRRRRRPRRLGRRGVRATPRGSRRRPPLERAYHLLICPSCRASTSPSRVSAGSSENVSCSDVPGQNIMSGCGFRSGSASLHTRSRPARARGVAGIRR